jgi:hypothetical protein
MRAILFLVFPALALGFCPLPKKSFATSSLGMAPQYDNKFNKWVVTSPEEGPEAGYDIWGSLVRQGPSPFINHVFKAEEYKQAVLKFMAGDQVDRNIWRKLRWMPICVIPTIGLVSQ